MPQDRSKNRTVLLLFTLTAILIAGTVFVGFTLQQSTAPASTGATGFGDTATRDYFATVVGAMAALTCEDFMSIPNVQTGESRLFGSVYSATPIAFAGGNNSPFCQYKNYNGMNYSFYVQGYSPEATIDDSAEALYTRVNAKFFGTNTPTKYQLGPVTMFFGLGTNNYCKTLFYHETNDFEYGLLEYSNQNDCSLIGVINSDISAIIANNLTRIMNNVYAGLGRGDLISN